MLVLSIRLVGQDYLEVEFVEDHLIGCTATCTQSGKIIYVKPEQLVVPWCHPGTCLQFSKPIKRARRSPTLRHSPDKPVTFVPHGKGLCREP